MRYFDSQKFYYLVNFGLAALRSKLVFAAASPMSACRIRFRDSNGDKFQILVNNYQQHFPSTNWPGFDLWQIGIHAVGSAAVRPVAANIHGTIRE